MRQWSYFLTVIAISLTGIICSLFFFPDYKEESLMYLYDNRYYESYDRFKKLYQAGDESLSVSIPLVWLHMHFANSNQAISVLERYVQNNPKDIEAKIYLAQLYKELNKPYKFAEYVNEIKEFAGSDQFINQSSFLNQALGNFENQKMSFSNLIEQGKAKQENYIELAYILASQGKMAEALAAFRTLIKDNPLSSLDDATVQTIIRAELEYGSPKKAIFLAQQYVHSTSEIGPAITTIELLNEQGYVNESFELLHQLSATQRQDPSVKLAEFSLLMNIGKAKEAYQILKKAYEKKYIPNYYLNTLFLLGLEYEKDITDLATIASEIDVLRLSNEDVLEIIYKLMEKKSSKLTSIVKEKFDADLLERGPVIFLALDMMMKPQSEKEEEKLRQAYTSVELNDNEKVEIAKLYRAKGYDKLAGKAIGEINSFETIKQENIFETARLFIDYGMGKKGLGLIDIMRNKNPPKETDVDEAWILLSTAEGKTEQVSEFLKHDDTVEQAFLEDSFYLARELEYDQIALDIAKEMIQRNDSIANKRNLAVSYIENDQAEKAILILNELAKMGVDVKEEYFQALIPLAKIDVKYLDELLKEIETRLQNESLSVSEKRDYAYLLIENGFVDIALPILMQITEGKPFLDPDVQTILYAKGDRISEKTAQWAYNRGMQAEDKVYWMKFLADAGFLEMALGMVSIAELNDDETIDIYLEVVGNSNNKALIEEVVRFLYPKTIGLPLLVKLGKLAYSSEKYSLAKKIYLKVNNKDPNNKDALRNLAIILFSEGNLMCAKLYFRRLLDLTKHDILANYYYAEIIWQKNKKELADLYFRNALRSIISTLHNGDFEKQDAEDGEIKFDKRTLLEMLGKIYVRLGALDKFILVYTNLLRDHPTDAALRSEYANILLDNGEYYSAACILSCFAIESKDKCSENYLSTWARYLKETGKIREALFIIHKLHKENPESPSINESLADAYYSAGHWRKSKYFMREAISYQPNNEGYRKIYKDIIWDKLPYLNVAFNHRKTGQTQREQFYRLDASSGVNRYSLLNFKYELDHINLEELVRSKNGITAPFRGNRERSEIALLYNSWEGIATKGTLYYSEGDVGAGIEWAQHLYNDIYTSGIDIGKPNWDTVEGTVQGGTIDRVYIRRFRRLNRQWDGHIGWSYNRYNLHNFPSADVTWKLEGLLSFHLPTHQGIVKYMGDEANVSLNYQLDKEQVDRRKKKRGADGEQFFPLFIQNREVHNFYVYFGKRFNEMLFFEGYFGYTYDRVPDSSMLPIGGASLVFFRREDVQARVDYNHTVSTEDAQTIVNEWIINLRYVY